MNILKKLLALTSNTYYRKNKHYFKNKWLPKEVKEIPPVIKQIKGRPDFKCNIFQIMSFHRSFPSLF